MPLSASTKISSEITKAIQAAAKKVDTAKLATLKPKAAAPAQ